ncbi:hypothetical protein QE109_12890 [Fusibacter bizertensis]|uniref:Uncharacterized protein n=1 Tax=Fusibacter bizertensis TaxID=1488331 RepID=A0ABT6NF40_9FIRM|nr:hypothetical protein [Fusibacter bizertensis]MDH8679049.1 hypothetical protein [Fusibacter bizertensis]
MNTAILAQDLRGLCGQTCIALLMNMSVEEVVKATKCGKGKMSGRKLFEALDLFQVDRAEKMKYNRGKQVELPECCILSEHGHFLLYYKSVFYDNIKGVFSDYDYSQLVAYLEINLVERM